MKWLVSPVSQTGPKIIQEMSFWAFLRGIFQTGLAGVTGSTFIIHGITA